MVKFFKCIINEKTNVSNIYGAEGCGGCGAQVKISGAVPPGADKFYPVSAVWCGAEPSKFDNSNTSWSET